MSAALYLDTLAGLTRSCWEQEETSLLYLIPTIPLAITSKREKNTNQSQNINTQCMSCLIIRVLDKYYVGELADNEHPVFPEMG